MEQIQHNIPDAQDIASEAQELRRLMDEPGANSPLKERAHQASMRALAVKLENRIQNAKGD
jgi:hypothetical protein